MRLRLRIVTLVVAGGLAFGGTAAPAAAASPTGTLCSAAGLLSRAINPCGVVKKAGSLVGVGKKLVTGHPGAAVGAAAGAVGTSVVSIGLTAVAVWVLGGAKFALDETSKVLGSTTSPQLRSTWFSGTYWRMAGISAVLTLPFLFAAAVQALLRTDLSLLARAAFLHLPLSMLVVSIAAPLAMLLLAASDELSAIVSGAAGDESAHFLNAAALTISGLSSFGSPFLAFLIGVFTVAGAVVLWIELLMRETAVYVIVLMLPLAFAAFVWPARRIWAVRTLELLGALILSKFAIVAVLSLGGAALGSTLGHPSVANWLAGLVLVLMAAFMPWALLRLVPLAEVAGSAAGPLRRELLHATGAAKAADVVARNADDWLGGVTGRMRSQAEEAWPADEAPRSASSPERGEGESVGSSDPPDAAASEAEPSDASVAEAEGPARVSEESEPPNDEASVPGPAPPGRQPSPTRSATAPYDDSELFTSGAHTHQLRYGVPGQPSFVIESAPRAREPGAAGPTDEPGLPPVSTGEPDLQPTTAGEPNLRPATAGEPEGAVAATGDDPDPLPPPQDNPEDAA